MLKADFSADDRPLRSILCLGAHCDDIEIGCGGTLLKLLAQAPDREVTWVIFTSNETRAAEARKAAHLFLQGAARRNIVVHAFRDGFLPQHWSAIKDAF